MRKIQIAIDGPAGAGKSTVARNIAELLGYVYIDTGAMYRALTYKAVLEKLPLDRDEILSALAARTDITITRAVSGKQIVLCDGVDITEAIREPAISQKVSLVAQHPGVRAELVKKQQALAQNQNVVMDGRDIGTVVLPQAECKIFLTASLEERAKRRLMELQEKGFEQDESSLKADLTQRDQMDENRSIGPLRPAADAIILDTSNMSINEVIEFILEKCREQRGV